MTNKLKVGLMIASLLSASSSFAAGAAQLTGVKGTLKNVEKAIKAAVSKAEELFEQNGGAQMDTGGRISLLTGTHPFISILGIQKTDYRVVFKFLGTSAEVFTNGSAYGSSATVPVTKGLLGAVINLIPIYNTGDNVITSWECITNADATMKAFMGSKTDATIGTTSFISTNGNNGSNEYLSNCIYTTADIVTE